MSEEFEDFETFELEPFCDPDPALDVWDPEWDRDWEAPRDWAWEDAATGDEELGATVTAAAGAADRDTPRWIPPAGWTGAGEVFAAGFLHRDRYDDVPAGEGFASGGFMDELAAGPLLAALTSEATAARTSAGVSGTRTSAAASGARTATGTSDARTATGTSDARTATGTSDARTATGTGAGQVTDPAGLAGGYAGAGRSRS